jgi:cell wall-associated NlpC family hydrolase
VTVQLSRNQKLFASAFAQASGLDPRAIEAWMIAEEPAGASTGYRGTQDWLNIGITDSGPQGQGNSVWQDPVKAGTFSGRWLKGQVADPGFGKAAAGIQAIARTAGQSPQAQLTAVANSPWASSHYGGAAKLIGLLGQVGGKLPAVGVATGSSGGVGSIAQIPSVKAPTIAGPNLFTTLGGLEAARQTVAGDTSGTPDALQQGWDTLAALIAPSLKSSSGGIIQAPSASSPNAPQDRNVTSSALDKAVRTADALVGARYTWGGGHGGWQSLSALRAGGVDCSGFVSAVLHAAGLHMPVPQTTAGLPSYLAHGQGRFITVWDRAMGSQAHVIIDINGQFYESGGMLGGGVTKMSQPQAQQELGGGGFVPYHPNVVGGKSAAMPVHPNVARSRGGGDNGPISMHANADRAIAAGPTEPTPALQPSTLKTNTTPQPVAGIVPPIQSSTPTTPLPKASPSVVPKVNPSLVSTPTTTTPKAPDLLGTKPLEEFKVPKVAG